MPLVPRLSLHSCWPAFLLLFLGAVLAGCGDMPTAPDENLSASQSAGVVEGPGGATTLCDVQPNPDGSCGIVVTGPGRETPPPPRGREIQPSCDSWNPCGGGGQGSGGGGDSGSYQQGPIAFGICMLAATGSGVAIMSVADEFQEFHAAIEYKHEMEQVLAMSLPLSERITYQELDRLAYIRLQNAKSALSSAINTSLVAIGGAATTCGAFAVVGL